MRNHCARFEHVGRLYLRGSRPYARWNHSRKIYVIVSSSSQIGLVQALKPLASITVTRAKALSNGAIGNTARVMPGSRA